MKPAHVIKFRTILPVVAKVVVLFELEDLVMQPHSAGDTSVVASTSLLTLMFVCLRACHCNIVCYNIVYYLRLQH